MANNEMIHGGHRQRLKKRFLDEGLDHFSEHQVLELLLFYCISRQDTNPIAHTLLNHFGSLENIINATPDELKNIPGIGESTATFLPLLNALYRYCANNRPKDEILTTLDDCAMYMVSKFDCLKCETVYLLCLDAKGKVLCCKKVGEGSVNSAAVPIRKIVEIALNAGATSAVLAHNHPSGIAIPSNEDQLTTRQLAVALSAVDITLTDHVVVADGDWVSMRQSGWYDPADCHFIV
jgi:DNA repair protein RadC